METITKFKQRIPRNLYMTGAIEVYRNWSTGYTKSELEEKVFTSRHDTHHVLDGGTYVTFNPRVFAHGR